MRLLVYTISFLFIIGLDLGLSVHNMLTDKEDVVYLHQENNKDSENKENKESNENPIEKEENKLMQSENLFLFVEGKLSFVLWQKSTASDQYYAQIPDPPPDPMI